MGSCLFIKIARRLVSENERRVVGERAGDGGLTLSTFRDVPWNAPFYAALGFAPIASPEPALARLLAREIELGLTAYGARIAMGVRLSRM